MTTPLVMNFPVEEILHDLHTNILPYWMNRMIDHEHGGFYGGRNGHDVLEPEAPKGIILNTRILWTFSSAARHFGNATYLAVATRAFQYIQDHFMDGKNGGVYWMLDFKGAPLQTKKQVYAQAFALYAFAEYYLASGDRRSLQSAIDLFRLIEKHSFDAKDNGYLEAFDENWNLLDDLRLSEKDANEKKTMNTHLHVLEAYTVLYTVWKVEQLLRQLKNLINLFMDKIINKRYRYDLFFTETWKLQSTTTSFGHDIEGSWLLYEAAQVTGDALLLERVKDLAIRTVDQTLEDGLDEDGGLMNETEPDVLKDTDKHWWPQAEAIIGLVNAWQLTGNGSYLDEAKSVWQFIKEKLIDRQHGEWHWRVNRQGEVNFDEEKAGFWKCPYHNGRMAIEVARRFGMLKR